MRSNLSARVYLARNLRRVGVLVAAVALFVAMQYLVAYLLSSATAPLYSTEVELTEKLQTVYSYYEEETQKDPQFPGMVAKDFAAISSLLQEDGRVDHVISMADTYVQLRSMTGSSGILTALVDPGDMSILFDYLDCRLISGEMPDAPGEVLLDRRTAANADLLVGDTFSSDTFTVAGIMEMSSYLGIGICPEGLEKTSAVILSNGKGVDYNARFEDTNDLDLKGVITVSDNISGTLWYHEDIESSLGNSSYFITLISAVVVGLCLVIVLGMYMRDRHEEWCLLYSIGFSEKEIYGCAFRELLLTFSLGTVTGAVLTAAGVLLMKYFAFEPEGLVTFTVMPEKMLAIFCVLILMIGICQISIVTALRRIRTVDLIEEDTF